MKARFIGAIRTNVAVPDNQTGTSGKAEGPEAKPKAIRQLMDKREFYVCC